MTEPDTAPMEVEEIARLEALVANCDAREPVPLAAEDVLRLLAAATRGAGLDTVGAAEAQVGRWVYRRIERLIDAKAGTPEAAELTFLADIAVHVEEYGEEACADHALSQPTPALSPDAGVEDGEQASERDGVLGGHHASDQRQGAPLAGGLSPQPPVAAEPAPQAEGAEPREQFETWARASGLWQGYGFERELDGGYRALSLQCALAAYLAALSAPAADAGTRELREALERVRDQLGEGFHTALRKAADSPQADTAYAAIRDMKPAEWGQVLDFVLDGLGVTAALTRAGGEKGE